MQAVIDADADDVLSKRRTEKQPGAIERAVAWTKTALANGPVASKELDGMAAAVGIPHGTLNRAKEELRDAGAIVAKQIRQAGRVVGWSVALAGGEPGC